MLSVEVEDTIEQLAKEPHITQGGTVHAGTVIVSASGTVTSNGHTLSMNPQDIIGDDTSSPGAIVGRGSSGSVRRVRNKRTNEVMALKEIRITGEHHMKEIQRELETLNRGVVSQNPYLIDFFGAYSHEGSVFIAMECMDGSLGDCKKVPEPILAKMTKMVLHGLHYLHHERNLVHRDIKPTNLLFNKAGRVKISDFGISSRLGTPQSGGVNNSFMGTLAYMSPERLQGKEYDCTADVWSLGISLAEIFNGSAPFRASPERLRRRIPHGRAVLLGVIESLESRRAPYPFCKQCARGGSGRRYCTNIGCVSPAH